VVAQQPGIAPAGARDLSNDPTGSAYAKMRLRTRRLRFWVFARATSLMDQTHEQRNTEHAVDRDAVARGTSGFIGTTLARREARLLKRAIDIALSFVLLLLALPLYGYVACRIYFEDGRPVFFSQRRVGQAKREFGMFKFRSMVRDAEGEFARWESESPDLLDEYRRNNYKLRQDPRLLDVGIWLRRTSIDELPQLLNVLRGEMSLVGPRPLLSRELAHYGEAIALYQQVRPGLTGLWQVSGRSETTFEERAALDSWYIQNGSLWYDFVILFRTISVVMRQDGAH
jgi:lipopolysaccharide/colanic/teichoic acid biosynthesis glycosyltransferase